MKIPKELSFGFVHLIMAARKDNSAFREAHRRVIKVRDGPPQSAVGGAGM